jgi:uncharacterized protein YbbK (DUF523 family)
MKPVILVSACLLGEKCRYDGGHSFCKRVEALKSSNRLVPVCPEVLGGLSIPRKPCEIVGGDGKAVWEGGARVISADGTDYTQAFCDGALKSLSCCRTYGAQKAILKSGSPACGLGRIYDGSFTGTKRAGNGVLAELLIQNGILVVSE